MKLEQNLANMLSIGEVFTYGSVKSLVIDFTLQMKVDRFL